MIRHVAIARMYGVPIRASLGKKDTCFFFKVKMPKKKVDKTKPVTSHRMESFFIPRGGKPIRRLQPPEAEPLPATRARYFYEQGTGVAYAQQVGDMAVCLLTGSELFRIKSNEDDISQGGFESARFDFSPPSGKKHPGDNSIDVLALVAEGIISKEDIQTQKAFSREQLDEFMSELERIRLEREQACNLRV